MEIVIRATYPKKIKCCGWKAMIQVLEKNFLLEKDQASILEELVLN